MQIKNAISQSLTILGLLCLLFQAGCAGTGSKIWVRQEVYTPQLDRQLQIYKGTSVYLNSFTNRAENTSIFYYYSPDGKMKYEGAPTIASYLWYSFRKALLSVGMRVYEDAAPLDVPEVLMTFTSLTDQQFVFNIEVLKEKQLAYSKQCTVTAQPPTSMEPTALEQRAYKLIDSAVSAMLFDKGFQNAILGEIKSPAQTSSMKNKKSRKKQQPAD